MVRGAGEGQLFGEGDYFKYFRQRGGGRRLFEGGDKSRDVNYLSKKGTPILSNPPFHPRHFMGFSLELHEVLQYTNISSRYPNDEQLWYTDISSNIDNYLQSVSFETVFNALLTALVPTVKLSKGKRGHP